MLPNWDTLKVRLNRWDRGWWIAGLVSLAFFGLRLPSVVHLPGTIDEEFFAVPGLMVLRHGIPSIPYLHTDEPASYFAGADQILMVLPPLQFYLQAIFYAVFPAGYPTARLASLTSAVAFLLIFYAMSRRVMTQKGDALWATGLFALSRYLLFGCQSARPDMLCAVLGLIAIYSILDLGTDLALRRAAISGAACGFGLLAHPAALAYCCVIPVTLLLTSCSAKVRFQRLTIWGLMTALVASLWLPMIVAYPQEFQDQFMRNVVDRSGPGLFSRIVWPWDSLLHHWKILRLHLGGTQQAVLVAGFFACLVIVFRSRDRSLRRYAWITLGLSYAITVCTGVHSGQAYWITAGAMNFGALMAALPLALEPIVGENATVNTRFLIICRFAVLLLLLKGAGLVAAGTYLRNWGDPRYHAGNFFENISRQLPRDGLFASDLTYVFPLYLSGRTTILTQGIDSFYAGKIPKYDYMLLDRQGHDLGWDISWEGHRVTEHGDKAEPLRCSITIYGSRGLSLDTLSPQ